MIAALVPAAGLSTRMGRPKLLLAIQDRPLIRRVVAALREGGADRVAVVTPPDDQDGAVRIGELAREAGAETIALAAPTPDMRATIEAGLAYLSLGAEIPSGVLIVPGDSVGLTSGLVASVIARFLSDPSRIVLPVRGEKRGHPLALPWATALAIRELPKGVGVNALLSAREARVDRLPVDFPGLDADLDTPEDYRAWSAL